MTMFGQSKRLLDLWTDAWQMGWGIAETLHAAGGVIEMRSAMVSQGLSGTTPMPFSEMYRMASEKAVAFNTANLAAWRKLGIDAPSKLSAALTGDGMAMLALWERSVAASTAWWSPLHTAATSNHRRLHR